MAPPSPRPGETDTRQLAASVQAVLQTYLKEQGVAVSEAELQALTHRLVAYLQDGGDLLAAAWSFKAKYGQLELDHKLHLGASGRRNWAALAALAIVCTTILAAVWMLTH